MPAPTVRMARTAPPVRTAIRETKEIRAIRVTPERTARTALRHN